MKRNWLDMTVAFSALFVSVISLVVAMRMADANARLVSASSWPFLTFGAGTGTVDGVKKVHMAVGNTGVGPAKIESVELIWKGVSYRTDKDFLKACCGFDPASGQPYDDNLVSNEVLRAGDSISFLEFKQSSNPAVFAALQQAILSRDLQLPVCYCSIFDECWKSDLTILSLRPEPVRRCVQPAVPFDQGILAGKK